MDDIKRGSLQRQRDKIIRDLQVDHILDDLYSLQIVSSDDLENIRSKNLRKEQTSCLLDIISRKDNRAYDKFVNALKKDYDWLFKDLQNFDGVDNVISLEEEAFQDTLILGDVPRRPPHYVDRTAPLGNLRKDLEELQPCQRIVLFGMTGSGKSCLAAAAVKDSMLLEKCFHNRVFWINLGEVKSADQLVMPMNLLLQRLMNDTREVNNKARPVSINAAQDGNPALEISLLKDALKAMFRNGSYRQALLVLDNVSFQGATEAFDVGCRTLITTQVKDIVVGNNTIYKQVKGGFTEKETLLLFANSLKTSINRLPAQATKIHYLCKGEPILIALIGSLLAPYKDDLLINSDHWEYFIKKLTKKDYTLKVQLFGAISICIEGLSSELRELYYNFAVFVEDVNITPQVMQTIWNLGDKYDVQEKMTELENKSLIVSYYNKELKTYVYGIHDLFLAYLRQQLGKDIVEQHRKLIMAYKHISNENYTKLPNDNYIYQYIGYHLKEAQLYDEFKIYFDLNFIGAKIKAIGTADLLRDYQLYKQYITRNDDTLLLKLDEYINFVKAKGYDLFKYSNTDVVQSGLGQNRDSAVYKAALNIAKENPKRLYLQLQAHQEGVHFTHTLDLQHDISAACFTADVNQILVGMKNGDIALWEQDYNRKLYVFSGHTSSIISLRLSPNGNEFLSVSTDGSVKIWVLEGTVLKNSNGDIFDENGCSKNVPSPRVKQSNWTNFYESNGRVDHSKTCRLQNGEKLLSASYANELEHQIITGSSNGRVLIWNTLTDEPYILLEIPGRGHPVSCVTFSIDDTLAIFSCDGNIFLHNAETGEFLSQFCNKTSITLLLNVPELFATLIAMNKTTITMWTWTQHGVKIEHPAMTVLNNKSQGYNLCGVVTEDGSYLVTSSSDHYIRILHIATVQIVQEIFNNKGLVVCLDTFYDDRKHAVHILLSGSDDKSVKQWQIQPTLPYKDTVKLLPIFDCFWNGLSSVPRIAVVNSSNTVQIMNGHSLLVETEKLRSPIKVVRFSLCGNKVAIGVESGDIIEFDFKIRNYVTLMKLHDSVVLLKYFSTKESLLETDAQESSILVAAAHNGWVTVRKTGKALCLIQPPPCSIPVKQVPIIPIVQCFYIKSVKQLLAVSQNRVIKLWNIEDGSFSILCGEKGQHNEGFNGAVTMATISNDQTLLAITMADRCFEIYSMFVHNSTISLTHIQGKALEKPLRCCRFSHNGKILAIGQDNGDIVIWSVDSNVILGTLQLHKSMVRYLEFSPAPALILISVGEQIAWWDLTKMPSDAQDVKGYRRRSNSAKKKSLIIDTSGRMSQFNLGFWNDKEGPIDKPHLLSAIKVRGMCCTHISASYDFTSFFTIDQNGYLYIMEVLQ